MTTQDFDSVYCWPPPCHHVLRNKFGITDARRLAQQESNLVASALFDLANQPATPPFDTARLKATHKALFGAIYEWAGEFRSIDISREHQPPYCRPPYIPQELDRLFTTLRRANYFKGYPPEALFDDAVHPFREGNGRTQREMVRQLLEYNGYRLAWNRTSQAEVYRASAVNFVSGDSTLLRKILIQCCINFPGQR